MERPLRMHHACTHAIGHAAHHAMLHAPRTRSASNFTSGCASTRAPGSSIAGGARPATSSLVRLPKRGWTPWRTTRARTRRRARACSAASAAATRASWSQRCHARWNLHDALHNTLHAVHGITWCGAPSDPAGAATPLPSCRWPLAWGSTRRMCGGWYTGTRRRASSTCCRRQGGRGATACPPSRACAPLPRLGSPPRAAPRACALRTSCLLIKPTSLPPRPLPHPTSHPPPHLPGASHNLTLPYLTLPYLTLPYLTATSPSGGGHASSRGRARRAPMTPRPSR